MQKKFKPGDKINVGVIGCGQIAQIMHLPYICENENFNLYSVCDLSRLVIDSVGELYHIPAGRRFTDMDAMLADEALDAVIICTKDHYEPGVKAAKAGKHMIIEKPLAYSLAQCDEIISLAKEKNLVLQVGYMKRYDPGFQYALEKIKTLKNVNLVRVHDYGGSFDFTTKIYDLYAGTDIPKEVIEAGSQATTAAKISEIGKEREAFLQSYDLICGLSSHDTILMRHAFGDPKVLFAHVSKPGFVTAVLEFENGVQCVFESGLVTSRRSWDESLWVYSDDCNMSVHFPWPYLKNAPTVVRINENEEGSMINYDKEVVSSFDESYRREWKHFYECITEGKTPFTCGEDARKDIKLASDIIKAVKL